jgi:hypothetical protein
MKDYEGIEIKFPKNQKLPEEYYVVKNCITGKYIFENDDGYQSRDFDTRYEARKEAINHCNKIRLIK